MAQEWTLTSTNPQAPHLGGGTMKYDTLRGFVAACFDALHQHKTDLKATLPDGRQLNEAAIRDFVEHNHP